MKNSLFTNFLRSLDLQGCIFCPFIGKITEKNVQIFPPLSSFKSFVEFVILNPAYPDDVPGCLKNG